METSVGAEFDFSHLNLDTIGNFLEQDGATAGLVDLASSFLSDDFKDTTPFNAPGLDHLFAEPPEDFSLHPIKCPYLHHPGLKKQLERRLRAKPDGCIGWSGNYPLEDMNRPCVLVGGGIRMPVVFLVKWLCQFDPVTDSGLTANLRMMKRSSLNYC